MDINKLTTTISLLLAFGILTTFALLVSIMSGMSAAGLEFFAVLSISLIVTPVLFCGFVFRSSSVTISDIYKDYKSGFIAVFAFGLSAIIASSFWQDWLTLLQNIVV